MSIFKLTFNLAASSFLTYSHAENGYKIMSLIRILYHLTAMQSKSYAVILQKKMYKNIKSVYRANKSEVNVYQRSQYFFQYEIYLAMYTVMINKNISSLRKVS